MPTTGTSGLPSAAASLLGGYAGDDTPLKKGPPASQIQGNVLAGFGMKYQSVMFLQFKGEPPPKTPEFEGKSRPQVLLARLIDPSHKSAVMLATTVDALKNWVNPTAYLTGLSLTYSGLLAINPKFELAADEFRAFCGQPGLGPEPAAPGPVARAASLGDVSDSDPVHWVVGGTNPAGGDGADIETRIHNVYREPIHAILTLASNSPDGITAGRAIIERLLDGCATLRRVEQGSLAAKDDLFAVAGGGRELGAIGFMDGASQPKVEDYDSPGAALSDNAWVGALVPAGEFVMGYPSAIDYPRPRPFRNWMVNGSFHVFRRLTRRQGRRDVWAQLVRAVADEYRLPSGQPDLEFAAAKLVGRWPNGLPLALVPNRDAYDDAKKHGQLPTNDFDYDGDPMGETSPLFTHIRKLNPRTGNPSLHRLLRRGLPYRVPAAGGAPTEVGVLFHAYMASIEDQFEYLQQVLANQSGFPPGTASGQDPLVGALGAGKNGLHFSSGHRLHIGRAFKTTGAVYAFVPSKFTLQVLAGVQATPLGFFDKGG